MSDADDGSTSGPGEQPASHTLEWIVAETPVVVYALKPVSSGVDPIWVCPNVERILGHRTENTYDGSWWQETIHPADRDEVVACRDKARADGSATMQYRVRDGLGQYRWVHDEIRRASGGELVGAWTDITEHKEFEAELQHKQRMEALGELAGGVAHDVNNMLTVILGSCEALGRKLSEEHAARHGAGIGDGLRLHPGCRWLDTCRQRSRRRYGRTSYVRMREPAGRSVRQHIPRLPVLFISGYAGSGAEEEIPGPGNRFLQKPFAMEQMLDELCELLTGGSE